MSMFHTVSPVPCAKMERLQPPVYLFGLNASHHLRLVKKALYLSSA